MLIGEYSHSVDAKGRLIFPAKLRESLGEQFILTKGFSDPCLYVYSMEEWGRLEERIKTLPMSRARELQRFLFSSAALAEADKQGRIVIPGALREYAGITKDVTVVGAMVRAEIWDQGQFKRSSEHLTSDYIASAMEELGF